MSRRLIARVAGITLAVGALAACGSHTADVTPAAARSLHDGVQLVRAAAIAHDRAGAAAAVDHLERTLATLRGEGKVSVSARTRISHSIARVRARLGAIPTTTTTTTTTSTRPEDGHGKDKRRGKDHGGGHD